MDYTLASIRVKGGPNAESAKRIDINTCSTIKKPYVNPPDLHANDEWVKLNGNLIINYVIIMQTHKFKWCSRFTTRFLNYNVRA